MTLERGRLGGSLPRVRTAVVALLVAAACVLALPAGALALPSPEVFLRADAGGPIVPAQGARIQAVGRVDVLIRMQPGARPANALDDGRNHNFVRLRVTAQPVGAPEDPLAVQCAQVTGAPGEIVLVTSVPFAGVGRYAVDVVASTAAEWGREPECPTGPVGATAWTNETMPTLRFRPRSLIGIESPRAPGGFELLPVPGTQGSGLRVATACALGGVYAGEGRFTGARRTHAPTATVANGAEAFDFPEPGAWTCVARLHLDEGAEAGATLWSAPATGDLVGEAVFYGPRFLRDPPGARPARLSGRLAAVLAGQRVTLTVRGAPTLFPPARLRRPLVVRRTVGAGGTISLPITVRPVGCYLVTLRIAASRFILPTTMVLIAYRTERRLGFPPPRACRPRT